jgi:hypothetical protein
VQPLPAPLRGAAGSAHHTFGVSVNQCIWDPRFLSYMASYVMASIICQSGTIHWWWCGRTRRVIGRTRRVGPPAPRYRRGVGPGGY